jgi:hypothetical protein
VCQVRDVMQLLREVKVGNFMLVKQMLIACICVHAFTQLADQQNGFELSVIEYG